MSYESLTIIAPAADYEKREPSVTVLSQGWSFKDRENCGIMPTWGGSQWLRALMR